MQAQGIIRYKWRWIAALAAIALLIWARALVWQAVGQLFLGMLVAMAALPIMKWLEKRVSSGLAASLAMTSLSVALIALLMMTSSTSTSTATATLRPRRRAGWKTA